MGINSSSFLPNLNGYEYYKKGIFTFGPVTQPTTSNIVEHFDWRDRHGASKPFSPYYDGDIEGWITPWWKGQGCYDCWVFSPMYSTEAIINLYFNNTSIDMELSGQDALSCASLGSCIGYTSSWTCNFLTNTGMLTESEFPYYAANSLLIPCSSVPSNGNNKIKTSGYTTYSAYTIGEDSIKELLITKGPLVFDLHYPWRHTMSLVGFGKIHVGDTIKIGDSLHGVPAVVVLPNSQYIGMTYWTFKQSYSDILVGDTSLYINVIKNLDPSNDIIRTIECPISNIGNNPNPLTLENARTCRDEDNDGYCWWGIGSKPNCPSCPDERDCDDSDPNVGPYDSKYGCTPICDFVDAPIYISTNTTIWDDHFYNRNIIIENGATLEVKSTLSFSADAKIIIQQGGSFILNGGHLTSGCSEMWEGIEVWGDNNYSQFVENGIQHQGYLELKNGAIIENAQYAVRLWNPDSWKFMGGIVKANDVTFKNNWKAVEFMQYQNYYPTTLDPAPNQSCFEKCDFIVNNDFYWEDFHAQATLWDVTGIYFKGCNFKDMRTNLTESAQMGSGIWSLDANYIVKPYCDAPEPHPIPCPSGSVVKSRFSGLLNGIYAEKSENENTITVSQSIFDGNITGVKLEGVNQARILQSEFMIGNNPATDISEQYGINTKYSTGYRIEENSFTGSDNSITYNYGVYIYYSGEESNEVYKNTFTNLKYGGYAVAINRNNLSPYEGLQFLCNTCDNEEILGIDFSSMEDNSLGNRDKHGVRDFQGDYSISAGNILTQETAITNESDFTNATRNPIYYHHTAGTTQPLDYTTGYVFPCYISNANTCPSRLDPYDPSEPLASGELDAAKSSMAQEESSYLNLLYAYKQLIDGGNTNQLLNQIQLSWPEDAWELRAELLSRSPYLSEKVILEAASKNILPNAMLLEVCLANPDATRSESSLDYLESSIPNPMPDYMINLIRDSRDSLTTRTNLERMMAGYLAKSSYQSNIILSSMKSDPLNYNQDSIISYTYRKQTLPSYYNMIDLLMEKGQFGAASDSLAVIPSRFILSSFETEENCHYNEWLNFRQGIYNTGRPILNLDSAEIQNLISLGESFNDRAGCAIRNLLCFGFDYCIEPEVIISGQQSRPSFAISKPDVGIEEKVEVYPNPANTYIIMKLMLGESELPVTLTISDVSGKKLIQETIQSSLTEHITDCRNLSEGLYLYQVDGLKGKIKNGKITIKH